LELAFDKKSVRQLCESEARAARDLGEKAAKKLKARLADFRVVENVSELVVGKPCELDGVNDGKFVVHLCDGFRIIFCANHNSNPLQKSGRLDWSKVTRIKILEVNHDKD
jgi:toxin HigB-1